MKFPTKIRRSSSRTIPANSNDYHFLHPNEVVDLLLVDITFQIFEKPGLHKIAPWFDFVITLFIVVSLFVLAWGNTPWLIMAPFVITALGLFKDIYMIRTRKKRGEGYEVAIVARETFRHTRLPRAIDGVPWSN